MLLIVSDDDGLKSSEETGATDIKTKRLFVTGGAQHILFVHFSSFVYSCIISISSFRSISIFCLSLTFVYNVWQGFHFIHLRKLCGQRLSLSVSSLKVCDRVAKMFVPIHLSFVSDFLIH